MENEEVEALVQGLIDRSREPIIIDFGLTKKFVYRKSARGPQNVVSGITLLQALQHLDELEREARKP